MPPTTPALPEFELPSVQLQLVEDIEQLQDNETYQVFNRIPAPEEVQVPFTELGQKTPIRFQLWYADGLPSPDTLAVYVNEETAFAGGVQPGFSGSAEILGEGVLAVTLTPDADYESAEEFEVTVSVNDQDIESWSFTMQDDTRPWVAAVIPLDVARLEVAFDESIDEASAEVPEHYAFERVSTFAVVPTVKSALKTAHSMVTLELDQPLTFGATYRLVATGVTDVYGNPVDPAHNAFEFTAYSPPVPQGRRFLLWDFIPEFHKREDVERGDLERLVTVVQEPTNLLLYEIDRFATVSDPDRAPEDFVDAMLRDLGCPFDLTSLDLGDKRKLLNLWQDLLRLKGTEEGIVYGALALFELDVEVIPLNEGGWLLGVHELQNWETTWLGPETSYQRFTFEVTILTPRKLRDDLERTRLVQLIEFMRTAHTHFWRLNEWVDVGPAE